METTSVQYKIAKWISRIFHPFLVAVLTLTLATYQSGAPVPAVLLWVGISFATVILPVSLYILWMVRKGKYSDAYVSIREQRHSLYYVATLCLVALVVILAVGDPPLVVTACIVSGVLANGVGMLINRFTKISVHSAAMAGCTAVLLVFAPVVGWVMVFATLITGWARMVLKAHTISQIGLGYLVASSSVVVVFRFFGLI
ncbi:MAG: hypothetical protein HUU38_11715 [Anaerolineales bacterium]|nr:hypothetical protein [Anaerolineales bacterium]